MQNIRKWLSLLTAIVLYYVIHEDAHLIVALIFGNFKKIRIVGWGLGVQVVIDSAKLSPTQLLISSMAGVIATLLVSYYLVRKTAAFAKSKHLFIRSISFYTTLVLLICDPVYLSILHRFVGGGDMNGIAQMGWSTNAASVIFFLIAIVNTYLFIKFVYPKYKKSFDLLQKQSAH